MHNVHTDLLPDETSDNYLLSLAFEYKSQISPAPRQSSFRVFSIVTFRDDDTPKGKIKYILGTNTECCYIQNSLCAERSALVQLRFLKGVVVEKVYVVSDAQEFLTPGALCREFMMDNYCDEHTLVLTCGENKAPRSFLLSDLYPYPNIYINTERDRVINFGRLFIKRAQSFSDFFLKLNKPHWAQLHQHLITLSNQTLESDLSGSPLHPICYAAGVLFDDNKFFSATQHNAIEYGCSVDPITRLTLCIETEKKSGNNAVVILQTDQFGILHAPSSVARAYLYESNFGKVQMVVHTKTGELKVVSAEELLPFGPKVEELFKKSAKI